MRPPRLLAMPTANAGTSSVRGCTHPRRASSFIPKAGNGAAAKNLSGASMSAAAIGETASGSGSDPAFSRLNSGGSNSAPAVFRSGQVHQSVESFQDHRADKSFKVTITGEQFRLVMLRRRIDDRVGSGEFVPAVHF